MTATIDGINEPRAGRRSRPRDAAAVLAGTAAGTALGIAARIWMRIIATDPEFTWSGTTFIVLGFTIFGLGQSVASLARRRGWRPFPARTMRLAGCLGMMPLFLAAGAIMAPTVLCGGLALWRADWTRWVRVVLALVAAAPVVVVSRQISGDFGWDGRTLLGVTGMLAVYGCIIRGVRPTMLRPVQPWRLRRVALVIGAAVTLLLVAQIGLRGG